eukprot:491085-Lingulodinium_polyedra.AAC.1
MSLSEVQPLRAATHAHLHPSFSPPSCRRTSASSLTGWPSGTRRNSSPAEYGPKRATQPRQPSSAHGPSTASVLPPRGFRQS